MKLKEATLGSSAGSPPIKTSEGITALFSVTTFTPVAVFCRGLPTTSSIFARSPVNMPSGMSLTPIVKEELSTVTGMEYLMFWASSPFTSIRG